MPTGVNVSVTGCLFLCFSPATRWQPVQGVPSRPMVAGIGSSAPATLNLIRGGKHGHFLSHLSLQQLTGSALRMMLDSFQNVIGMSLLQRWSCIMKVHYLQKKESDTCYKYIKFNFTAYALKYTTFLWQTDDHTLVN